MLIIYYPCMLSLELKDKNRHLLLCWIGSSFFISMLNNQLTSPDCLRSHKLPSNCRKTLLWLERPHVWLDKYPEPLEKNSHRGQLLYDQADLILEPRPNSPLLSLPGQGPSLFIYSPHLFLSNYLELGTVPVTENMATNKIWSVSSCGLKFYGKDNNETNNNKS